ncbi:uncharacterized protein LOC129840407 isoform X2 [Salvelinus fontinalis]|uniref:uncharacterized protein LOC129840407 isoform X2 n=1 Tax=Salvelinus fontinalis TaxID=8038 RepID=UPI002484F646|nr:uncharacterized protein LOC129840407 isoform X2 [Salvelinus fontinalis]
MEGEHPHEEKQTETACCASQCPKDGEERQGQRAMLWSIQEAVERQTMQIGVSACGATAVVDVLQALGIIVAPEMADRCVRTCLRRNEAPLPDYLFSRSEAGATHAQLIAGAEQASGGRVLGRHFPLHPRRRVRLVPWLAQWIQKGAVPVATMNMQLAVPEGEEVPDAWHHQLIFGVGPDTVYMTNPLDVVSEREVHQRLCSESVLLIRREDVLLRLTGQLRQMIREEDHDDEDQFRMSHVVIPAAYSSGVTVFALRDSDQGQELLHTPELSLL